MALAQHFPADGREHVVVVVVPEVERQIAQDALDRARPDQRSRAAGTDAVVHRLLGQVLHQVPHTGAGEGGLVEYRLPGAGAAWVGPALTGAVGVEEDAAARREG